MAGYRCLKSQHGLWDWHYFHEVALCRAGWVLLHRSLDHLQGYQVGQYESDSQYQLWWDHFWSTCYSRSPLNNLIFQSHLWSTLLCRSLGDFPLSREEHGRWMDLLYVIQSLCRQACSSHNSTCTICQIRHKETNSETVTLSIFMQVVDVVFFMDLLYVIHKRCIRQFSCCYYCWCCFCCLYILYKVVW